MEDEHAILILDSDDMNTEDGLSLKEFIEIINQHVANVNVNPDEVFVKLRIVDYEDDDFFECSVPEILFLARK